MSWGHFYACVELNFGNASYHSDQNLLFSLVFFQNLKKKPHKTTILPVVLYVRQTWSLTARVKHSLRVFQNRVLRRICGPKREEVAWGCRRLHNEELHNLFASPNIIRVIKSRSMRWSGHVARMRETKNAYKGLVGKYEGKRPLGRPRRRWEDIRIYIWEIQ
jgi:hypothetical protein